MAKQPVKQEQEQEQDQIRVHVSPELDYKYRDVVSVFASAQEVILEFGSRHRSIKSAMTVYDRIVLSPANAVRLQQALGKSLTAVQEVIRKQMEEANAESAES